jgi:predicted tellurium resistance membrane protein TerC
MDSLINFNSFIALVTLTVLELVLGIDNIIFISIISDRLPDHQRQKARITGLSLAVITRIALLLSLSWIIGLTTPLFHIMSIGISGRDLVLILGGLFLIAKSTHEIHQKFESMDELNPIRGKVNFTGVITQILLLDMVFSLDSVITAVGMVNEIPIMVIAILCSTAIMIVASKTIADFIDRHPTLKMLALSFLVLIGVALIADGLGQHIPKGYIYFAMGYSVVVEILNIQFRKKNSNI